MRLRALVVAALAGGAAAQPEAFERAYAHAEEVRLAGSGGETVRAAYRAAVAAFAALDRRGDAGYRSRALAAAGFAAFQAGDDWNALAWIDEAMAQGQLTQFLVEYRVRVLVRRREAGKALATAHEFAETFDVPADVLVQLQEAAAEELRRGESERALWLFEQLARDDDPIALGNLALALRSVGREADCERAYLRALARAPGDHVLWNDYGLFLKGVGRTAEALEAFRESLANEGPPHDGPAAGNLVALTLRGVDAGLDDPARAIARVLASRPQADVARRRCIDAVLASVRTGQTAGTGR